MNKTDNEEKKYKARGQYSNLRLTQYYSNIQAGPLEIGARIYSIRKFLGLTQEEIAKNIGLSNSNYRRCEAGEFYPPTGVIINLHEIYGVDIQWLLYGTHTLHMDILNGIAVASEEEKFDVFTRLYSYFAHKKFNCFSQPYSECQSVEHFAEWDTKFYKPIDKTNPPEDEIEFKNDICIKSDVMGFMEEYMPEELEILERAINLIKSQ